MFWSARLSLWPRDESGSLSHSSHGEYRRVSWILLTFHWLWCACWRCWCFVDMDERSNRPLGTSGGCLLCVGSLFPAPCLAGVLARGPLSPAKSQIPLSSGCYLVGTWRGCAGRMGQLINPQPPNAHSVASLWHVDRNTRRSI